MYQSVPQEIMFIPAQKLLKNSMSLWNYYLCPLPLSPNPTTAKAWDSQGYLATGLKLHKCSTPGCHGSVCSVALSPLLILSPSRLFFASSHSFLGPDCSGSPFLLWKARKTSRSGKWPFGEVRERVAGLHSSPIQHPLSSTTELVTDDNLLLASIPSKLWQEQRGKRGDCCRCNSLMWTSGRQWLRGRLQPREVCWHGESRGAQVLPAMEVGAATQVLCWKTSSP